LGENVENKEGKFMLLGDVLGGGLFYLILIFVVLFVLYLIIKLAVKHAILEILPKIKSYLKD
jgi:uncharacterized membrane protein YccC